MILINVLMILHGGSRGWYRIEPPEPFVFAKPDGWPQWKRRFEQFIIASGVSEECELRKVSTLLYCLGPDAEDFLVSTNVNSEERKK